MEQHTLVGATVRLWIGGEVASPAARAAGEVLGGRLPPPLVELEITDPDNGLLRGVAVYQKGDEKNAVKNMYNTW